MSDDLRDRKHLHIAARVIVVLMGVDDVPYRMFDDGLNHWQDIRVVSIEHIVYVDDAFIRDIRRNIPALSCDQIQVIFDFLNAQWTRRLRSLSVDYPSG